MGCSLKISLLDYVIEAAQPFPQSSRKTKVILVAVHDVYDRPFTRKFISSRSKI